jgi:DNA mismatch endonuclease (patch repair protein)
VHRDARNRADLEAAGWTVVTVWECELNADAEDVVRRLMDDLRRED